MTIEKSSFIIIYRSIDKAKGLLLNRRVNVGPQPGDAPVDDPKNQLPSSSVTISMLISESVYKLVVVVERIIRWFNKAVLRPYLFLFRCLVW